MHTKDCKSFKNVIFFQLGKKIKTICRSTAISSSCDVHILYKSVYL